MMEKTMNRQKDPLMHIVKRDQITVGKMVGIKLLALFLAFIVSSIILAVSEGASPIAFLVSLFRGLFEKDIWITLKGIAILLGLGLALLPAFKMKYWNIGADGQTLMGALAAYMVLYSLQEKMPSPLICIICLFAAVFAGIVWAVIPAIFKAKWNTNETLFTLMMNYVAIQCVLIYTNVIAKSGSGTLDIVRAGALPMINKSLTAIIIIALLLVVIAVYIKHTKHGFELSLVGESVNTAKYVGINVKKVVIRTLVLSGAVCGLIGFILVNGFDHVVSSSTVGGRGFTAIIVVWLANFNPYYMILTAFMIIFLQNGADELLDEISSTNDSIPLIITSIFIFFIIGCTFFSRYRVMFRKMNNEDYKCLMNKKIDKCKKKKEKCENDEKNKLYDDKIAAYEEAIANYDETSENAIIDNGFVRFLSKIFVPIYKFFAKIYYGIEFVLKKIGSLFKKNKKDKNVEVESKSTDLDVSSAEEKGEKEV